MGKNGSITPDLPLCLSIVPHWPGGPLRNGTPSNLKLHHISKNPSKKLFWQEDEALLANEALCLSTMVNLVL
jgi:hypothetical protein